jgi:drug/metabolite transporter (DMT)-like permease
MQKIKGNIFAFLGTSIFAVNFVSMKVLVDLLPVRIIIFLRFALASIFLFLILYFVGIDFKISSKKDKYQLILTGFLGTSLYYMFFSYSLKYISPSLTSLLCSLIPLITLLVDSIINKEKLKKSNLLLFIISIFGVYLVIDLRIGADNYLQILKGTFLMLMALAAWISYTIKAEYLLKKYNTLVILAYQCLFGSLITLLFTLDSIVSLKNIFAAPEVELIIMNIIFVSFFASALAYYFYNLGIRYLGVTLSSAYMNTMPAITLFASYFFIGSSLSTKKILGVFIVTTATLAAGLKDKFKKKNIKNIFSNKQSY